METKQLMGGTLEHRAVAEAMHAGAITCPPQAPLRDVARLMAEHGIHAVIVYSEGHSDEADADDAGPVWGVVSDANLIAAAAVGDLDGRTAGGTARTAPVTVAPDATLRSAAALMRMHGVTHLVVVEGGSDRPRGVISTLDLARAIAAEPATS